MRAANSKLRRCDLLHGDDVSETTAGQGRWERKGAVLNAGSASIFVLFYFIKNFFFLLHWVFVAVHVR